MKLLPWLLIHGSILGLSACSLSADPESSEAVASWVQTQWQGQPQAEGQAVIDEGVAFVPEDLSVVNVRDPFQLRSVQVLTRARTPDFVLKGFWHDRAGPAALILMDQQLGAWRQGAWIDRDWRVVQVAEPVVRLSRGAKTHVLTLDASAGGAP
jgi:hypothetical protein